MVVQKLVWTLMWITSSKVDLLSLSRISNSMTAMPTPTSGGQEDQQEDRVAEEGEGQESEQEATQLTSTDDGELQGDNHGRRRSSS